MTRNLKATASPFRLRPHPERAKIPAWTFWLFLTACLPGWTFAVDIPSAAPERTAYTVTHQDAEKIIGDALIAQGAGSALLVTLIGDRARPLCTASSPVKTGVQDMQFDARSGRWSAMLVFEAKGSVLTPIRVQGRYDETTEVPMLSKAVDSGVTIEESDIRMTPYNVRRLRKDTVLAAAEMIGKTPRRAIAPDRPVRKSEIAEPMDVEKGTAVTLQYRAGGLLINTQGQTVEPGRIGSRIRAQNTTSHTVVSGMLRNGDIVIVSATPP